MLTLNHVHLNNLAYMPKVAGGLFALFVIALSPNLGAAPNGYSSINYVDTESNQSISVLPHSDKNFQPSTFIEQYRSAYANAEGQNKSAAKAMTADLPFAMISLALAQTFSQYLIAKGSDGKMATTPLDVSNTLSSLDLTDPNNIVSTIGFSLFIGLNHATSMRLNNILTNQTFEFAKGLENKPLREAHAHLNTLEQRNFLLRTFVFTNVGLSLGLLGSEIFDSIYRMTQDKNCREYALFSLKRIKIDRSDALRSLDKCYIEWAPSRLFSQLSVLAVDLVVSNIIALPVLASLAKVTQPLETTSKRLKRILAAKSALLARYGGKAAVWGARLRLVPALVGGASITFLGLTAFVTVSPLLKQTETYRSFLNSVWVLTQTPMAGMALADFMAEYLILRDRKWMSRIGECDNFANFPTDEKLKNQCIERDRFLKALNDFSRANRIFRSAQIGEFKSTFSAWQQYLETFFERVNYIRDSYFGILNVLYQEQQTKTPGLPTTTSLLDRIWPLYGVNGKDSWPIKTKVLSKFDNSELKEQMELLETIGEKIELNAQNLTVSIEKLQNGTQDTSSEHSSFWRKLLNLEEEKQVQFTLSDQEFAMIATIRNLFRLSVDDIKALVKGTECSANANCLVPSLNNLLTSNEALHNLPHPKYQRMRAMAKWLTKAIGSPQELEKQRVNLLAMGVEILNLEISRMDEITNQFKTMVSSEDYSKLLASLKTKVGQNAKPYFEPGVGFVRNLDLILGQAKPSLTLPRATGQYFTPQKIDHVLMQMVCGKAIENGDPVFIEQTGFTLIPIAPKITIASDDVSSICPNWSQFGSLPEKALSSLLSNAPGMLDSVRSLAGFDLLRWQSWMDPERIYTEEIRIPTNNGLKAFSNVLDYIRKRVNTTYLISNNQSGEQEFAFSDWWQNHYNTAVNAKLPIFEEQYKGVMSEFIQQFQSTQDSTTNFTGFKQGIGANLRQEFKFYLHLVGEIYLNAKNLKNKTKIPQFREAIADITDKVIGMPINGDRKLRLGNLYYELTEGDQFTFAEFKNKYPDLFSKEDFGPNNFGEAKHLKFQTGILNAFQELINIINSIEVKKERSSQKETATTEPGHYISFPPNYKEFRQKALIVSSYITGLRQQFWFGRDEQSINSLSGYQRVILESSLQKLQDLLNELMQDKEIIDTLFVVVAQQNSTATAK